ncbi:unnamed protein product [Prorocentrum cordatum]|uniref:Amidohydrolase-related domain-containing protein n=1 Tax=Prorocentrum cordatum TaxID=2364126 RepID=A0ABN9SIY5_9DINO|nr:unnamed protein product [Polarella glacialis]
MLQVPSTRSVDRRCRAIANASLAWRPPRSIARHVESGAPAPAASSGPADAPLLPGADELFDILIDDAGVITGIVPARGGSGDCGGDAWGEVLDAEGSLVLPGFVDGHVHLDKALLNARCCAETGTFPEALAQTLAAKRGFTVADIGRRARRVIESAVAFGTTRMRSHAEVDPEVGLRAVEALLDLKREFAWALDLQVAAFAQEGVRDGGALLREALRLGCDCVGSAPYCDPDPAGNIRLVFALAAEFGVGGVDFHLDYHLGDEKESHLDCVLAELGRARSSPPRVCLGHCTALSSQPPAALAVTAQRLRQAGCAGGVSVLALPASDVYMMARGDAQDRRRGVAPVDQLAKLGVRAAFATNNVQNLFTFTGDGDMLKVATLTAQMLQLGARAEHAALLRMATAGAAEVIELAGAGGAGHDLAAGCSADLVLLRGAKTATDAIAAPPVRRVVLKRGRIVAETQATVELFPPA